MQQLRDVVQVGQPPLPSYIAKHPGGEVLPDHDRLGERGHTAVPQDPAPAVKAAVDVFPVGLGRGGDALAAPAEQGRRGGGPGSDRRGRPLERLEQPQPAPGGRRREHVAAAVDDRRHPGGGQLLADEVGVGMGAHEHRDVPRADRLLAGRLAIGGAVLEGRLGREQPHDVGGEVAGDVSARRRRPGIAVVGLLDRRLVAVNDPDAERGVRRSTLEPGGLVGGRGPDLAIDDVLVAEPRVREQRVEGVEQRLVAAPVDAQSGVRVRGGGGHEVGVDVGAAEGVDRLLGIGDQHQRHPFGGERAVEDLPLNRVGVLELVDEDHVVARTQALPRRRPVRTVEDLVQPRQQIVVGHDRELALALLELVSHHPGQAVAHRSGAVLGLAHRLELGHRVEHRRARDLQRLGAGESRATSRPESPDVQVVESLLEQVGDILDERGLAIEIADGAELREYLLAEAVRRGDRGRVEVGDGARQPVAAQADLLWRARAQQRHHRVGSRVGCAGEDPRQLLLAPDQSLPDPVAELAGRHPGERDQKQPVERRALGDVAGGERGDRVRLTGAGARLEHGHARRERAAQVELGVRLDGPHRSLTASTASRPRQSRSA